MQNRNIAWKFLAVGIMWGSGFMWAEFALAELSWQFVSWIRGVLGAVTLLVIIAIARPLDAEGRIWPRSVKTWLHFCVVGALLAAVPNVFWSLGQLGVSSSLASIFNATTPIATAILAGLVFRVDRLGKRQWSGITIGVAGVVLVISPWDASFGGAFWNQLACIIAVLSVAAAFAYQRKYLTESPIHPITAAAIITIGAAVTSLVLTPFAFETPISSDSLAWIGALWLACLSGGVAYILNAQVITAWGATGASMVTYLSPLIGVGLGVAVLGEQMTWSAPVGGLIIIAGIVLSQSKRNAPAIEPLPARMS